MLSGPEAAVRKERTWKRGELSGLEREMCPRGEEGRGHPTLTMKYISADDVQARAT